MARLGHQCDDCVIYLLEKADEAKKIKWSDEPNIFA